ncbi:MAG: FAD-binding oxidoreductase [Paludibacteraceae bacterium]|nr:FAD-binding oxidoreductase [Paludibacteraceae bacterium]
MQSSKSYIQRLAWGTDAGFYRLIPEEVLHPADEVQVQQIICRAHREGKHITFRAAGTSLSGQTISDSLLVVCGKKWEHYDIHDNGATITLQPGIVGQRVNDILRPYGRYFTPDPASIRSAMVGGIVMNNASGMCCGTHANSYRMIESARLILADGTLLDTGDASSRASFERSHAAMLCALRDMHARVVGDKALAERIRRKYSIKNVTGLNILPILEYDDPFDIISHLLVGSEGTLAFLSSVTMRTAAIMPCSASALLLFPTTQSACEAVTAMKRQGEVSAAEFFDRKAMLTVENDFPELCGLPQDAGAVLIRLDAIDEQSLQQKREKLMGLLSAYTLCKPAEITSDKATVAKLWAMRAGIFPAVGGTRPIGTTCLIEDVAFPIEYLAEATLDLQHLFREHNYPDAVIYGHALEGNYHFILNQRFDTPESVAQYDRMMHAVVDLVVDKYHGSLKAEHGTGRNMAPFVRREWGDAAYELMCEIKRLFDPDNILNPGVIFCEDEQSYIRNIKPLPEVHELIDRCIECGFCEVNCVSCGFALSSRQRIIIQREITRLQLAGEDKKAAALRKAFVGDGEDLCAGDGLCATSCPIGINVGEYIHLLREQHLSSAGKCFGHFAGAHFAGVADSVASALALASVGRAVLGKSVMSGICKGLHYASGKTIPLWTPAVPERRRRPRVSSQHSEGNSRQSAAGKQQSGVSRVVYFPSCINQRLGAVPDTDYPSTVEATETLLRRAGYEVIYPEKMETLCCGTIWESKGMPDEADRKAKELEEALQKASNGGEYPVLCDQSPCLYRMRHTIKGMQLYEPVEFIQKYLLPRLKITKIDAVVAVHPTCSTRKMHLEQALTDVAKACAREVVAPEGVWCCGFAGDKGFTHPELNKWALRHLRAEIERTGATMGFSNSRTCEIGLMQHGGIPYMNIVQLVLMATEKG